MKQTQHSQNDNNLLLATKKGGRTPASQLEILALKQSIDEMMERFNKSVHEQSLLEIKFQNDRHIMSLEKKFQKQLSEVKKASDLTIENLKRSYLTEINQLKQEKAGLEAQIMKF